jgi:hypothetical protein
MALEEKDLEGLEGSAENVQKKEVAPIQDENVLALVRQLQEEIKELKQTKVAPSQQQQIAPIDQAGLLEKLVDKIQGNKTDTNGFVFEHNYVSEHEIDPEDVLPKDEWVTFVTHTVGHVIVDDLRNGKPVRVPFGKISFEYESTKQVKNGKETDLYNLSKYTCKSKKELNWLKSHSKYGSLFFDNIKGARSIDGVKAIKLASVMRGLQSMGQHDVVNQARAYGLNIGDDVNLLRGQIAQMIVDKQIRAENENNRMRVGEAELEAQIVGKRIN